MTTKIRVPNKAGWALDEALEHDPDIAELLEQLLGQIEREREAAKRRYDKNAQLRLADLMHTAAQLQRLCSRLAVLHHLARANEYDKR